MDWEIKGQKGGGKIAASFLFNPLFVIIPLGKSSILERKREGMRKEARGKPIRKIKCRSLKFILLIFIFVVLAMRQGSLR